MSRSQGVSRSDAASYGAAAVGAPSAQNPGNTSARSSRSLTRLVFRVALMNRRLWAIVASSVALAGILILLVIPRRYTSTASFVVEAAPTAGLSSAMAIISQLNPNLAGGDSPKFYVDLIRSRPVLEHLLELVPRDECDNSAPRPLLEVIDPAGKSPNERLANGIETLRGRVTSGYDLRTGVITVGIEAECPELARELADSLVASVNSFNIDRRQTRAKLRREFSEKQALQADSALHRAEDELSAFQSANRIMETPRLALESERLRRRVSERDEVAAALRRDASTARLEEINSIPALTIIEPPNIPIRASFPKRRIWGLAILLLAAAIGLVSVIARFVFQPVPPDADIDVATFHEKLARLIHPGSGAVNPHAG